MDRKQQFKEGLITNNPVLVQQIGLCATMAITTSLFNGLGMGLAVFVVVIGCFVTIVDLLLQAFVPALSKSLGVFIPLIVVNCIIIGRAEAFCQKHNVKDSFFDGIFQGLGYTAVLVAMSVIREFLGSGRFGGGLLDFSNGFRITLDGSGAGFQFFPEYYGISIMNLPFGGFLTLGVLIAALKFLLNKQAHKVAKEDE